MSTMAFGSLYPGRPSGQTAANPPHQGMPGTPAAVAPGGGGAHNWGNVPVLTGVSTGLGISVPVLIALGAMAWFLFHNA